MVNNETSSPGAVIVRYRCSQRAELGAGLLCTVSVTVWGTSRPSPRLLQFVLRTLLTVTSHTCCEHTRRDYSLRPDHAPATPQPPPPPDSLAMDWILRALQRQSDGTIDDNDANLPLLRYAIINVVRLR